MERAVQVYWAVDAADAHLVAGMLEEEGIRAEVENEMLQGGIGVLAAGPATAPRVLVHEADARRARGIVEDWERARVRQPEGAWVCGECGETVDSMLTVCDFCETQRGDAPPPPEPELRPRHVIAILIIVGVAEICVALVASSFEMSNGGTFLFSSLAGGVVAFKLTQSVFGGTFGERGRAMLGLVPASVAQISVGATVGLIAAASYFALAVWVLPPPAPEEVDELTQLAESSPSGFAAWVILAVVFAPLFEEFLFRGVMLEGFRARWGMTVSVVLVTLLFTLVHLGRANYWPGIGLIALFAIFLALIRIRTRSLVPAIACHLTYNAAMGVWLYFYASPWW